MQNANLSETLNRKGNGSTLLGGEKRKSTHQVMTELSESMAKQNKTLVRDVKQMSKDVRQMSASSKTGQMTSERIHDRLESLILEQRTTNILLSQLVAIHSSVLSGESLFDVTKTAEGIRQTTYNRVLRGE